MTEETVVNIFAGEIFLIPGGTGTIGNAVVDMASKVGIFNMTETAEICAIIPTYHPDLDFPSRLELVTTQVGCVIVVDDSACHVIASRLQPLATVHRNVVVLHNAHNCGLAASLNKGVREAKKLGYRWLLTLDDDTIVRQDMCRQLANSWAILSQTLPLGVLAMSWRQVSTRNTSATGAWRDKRMVITSGSLMSMETFDSVGPFRDEFIIDSVDSDYCLRVRAHGMRVIEVARQGFTQRLGHPRTVEWGPFRFTLQEHSPMRTYYRIRNSTALVIENWRREPLYLAGAVYCNLQQVLATLLFYEEKRTHFVAMADGLKHGWTGMFGFREVNVDKNECSANNG